MMTPAELSSFGSVIILVLVPLLASVWVWPRSSHPLTFVKLLATRMAQRVLPSQEQPKMQHYISGALGFIVPIVPMMLVMTILINMAEFPLFFDAILLFIALDFNYVCHQYQRVNRALGKEKKILAREALKNIVARDTHQLSDIGIAKASIESLLLRFILQYATVIFWFAVVGAEIAFAYRILLEFYFAWCRHQGGYQYFALPVTALVRLFSYLPRWFGLLCISITNSPKGALFGWSQSRPRDNTSKTLGLFGGALGIQLGGPVMYSGQKIRYHRVGAERQVRYSDVTLSYRAILRACVLFTMLCALIKLVIVQVF